MKSSVILQHIVACAAALMLLGLLFSPAASAQAPAPSIKSIRPSLAPAGALVQVDGTGFAGATFVSFNRVPATYLVNSDTRITAVVPAGAVSGLIRVNAPGGTAASRTVFTRGTPKITLSGLTPTQGSAGKLVQIIGTGFTGATSVKMHGKPARFIIASDSLITMTVPVGTTTGDVTVTTAYGSATSEPFRVL